MSAGGAAPPVPGDTGPRAGEAPIEPVFVPIDPPPPPRRPAAVRGDAVLRAIEASYASKNDLHEWLEDICGELDGLGLGSWGSLPVSDGLPVVGSHMIVRGADLFMRVNERATVVREANRTMHAEACVPESRIICVVSHWLRLFEERGISPADARRVSGHALPAATAVLCTSTDGREGVVALLDSDRPIPARIRYQLEGVAAHVEHAYRLRSALQDRTGKVARAVLSPDGKLLHAEADAISETDSLTLAVRESERARGRMRRLAPEEAIEAWKALVEGQWSIAEQVESDGKRFLLAFENAPVTPALKLSAQEKRVISYAALGHQQKYIAYELGLTPSTVSRHLQNALQKLRLKNRQELISTLGPRSRRTAAAGRNPEDRLEGEDS